MKKPVSIEDKIQFISSSLAFLREGVTEAVSMVLIRHYLRMIDEEMSSLLSRTEAQREMWRPPMGACFVDSERLERIETYLAAGGSLADETIRDLVTSLRAMHTENAKR